MFVRHGRTSNTTIAAIRRNVGIVARSAQHAYEPARKRLGKHQVTAWANAAARPVTLLFLLRSDQQARDGV